jgi:hypothetical protein
MYVGQLIFIGFIDGFLVLSLTLLILIDNAFALLNVIGMACTLQHAKAFNGTLLAIAFMKFLPNKTC